MNKLIPIILGILLLLLAAWMQITAFKPVRQTLQNLENISYDMELRTTLGHKVDNNSPIVIIDIDDKSLKEQGRWPWPRNKIAHLITDLQQQGAVVIALDMTFPELEINPVDLVLKKLQQDKSQSIIITKKLQQLAPNFDYDLDFAKSLQQGTVVLGMTFHDKKNAQTGISPTPLVQLNPNAITNSTFITMSNFTGNIPILQHAAKNSGFLNVFADSDGIIRRVPLVLRYQNDLYPSLALEATRLYLLSDAQLELVNVGNFIAPAAIKLGKQVIPTDISGQVLIPFRGPAGKIPHISATDILNHRIVPNTLTNKLVFVGASAFGLGDLQTTAIQSAYPGVEIHASIASGILNNHFPYKPAWMPGFEFSLTLFFGILFALLFPFLTPRWLTVCGLLTPIILIMLNLWLYQTTWIIASVIVPVLLILTLAILNTAYGYVFESRRRNQLKAMFGQYVPTSYIETILKHPGGLSLHGESREMTVLFSDIRNFTTLAESMSATSIKEVLNQFFTPMTRIIFEHKGTIDKYVGDMIMAFWGAPLPDPEHARHALETALDMQLAVERLKPLFNQQGLPEINIGIGVNTGLMNVGDMGSEFRRAYTVIGDSVNLASRLEALTKYYGVGIIVGEETQRNQPDFIFRKLDRVKVKGKQNAVDIYEPVCRRNNLSRALGEEIELSEQALDFYLTERWKQATDILNKLIVAHPAKRLYKLYLERIAEITK